MPPGFTSMDVVTGAFGYTGKYITRRLLDMGIEVKTLTGHPDRPDPFGGAVKAEPFNFDNPAELAKQLSGVSTLYNTYWVRFDRGQVTFDSAVENIKALIRAAQEAGVKRLVHVSITNPSSKSPLPYFRGKGLVEEAIMTSGLSYAIVRPTVVFGVEDVLLNNIGWLVRKFPFFIVPGDGSYRLQPIFVEDMAELAVQAGQSGEDQVLDAAGPEIYTFDELVRLIADAVGGGARIVHASPVLALLLSRVVGRMIGDVVLTKEEVEGLMAGLLVSSSPPLGKASFHAWINENRGLIGRNYTSELRRHYPR